VFRWVTLKWRKMSEAYRSFGHHTGCFLCQRRFENGEMMALAEFDKNETTHVALCQSCAIQHK